MTTEFRNALSPNLLCTNNRAQRAESYTMADPLRWAGDSDSDQLNDSIQILLGRDYEENGG